MGISQWSAALPASLQECSKNYKENLQFVIWRVHALKLKSWEEVRIWMLLLAIFVCQDELRRVREGLSVDRCWKVHSKDLDLACWWIGLWGTGAQDEYLRKTASESQHEATDVLIWSIFQNYLLKDLGNNNIHIISLNGLCSCGRWFQKGNFRLNKGKPELFLKLHISKYTGFSEDRSLKTFDRSVSSFVSTVSFHFRSLLKCFEI